MYILKCSQGQSFTKGELQRFGNIELSPSDWGIKIMGRAELLLVVNDTNHNSRLQLTRSKKGVIWFDQVSAMPLDTFKSLHCFWKVKAGGNPWGYIVFTSR